MPYKTEWSVEEQRILFRRMGYDYTQWFPDSKKEVNEVGFLARKALLHGVDIQGKEFTQDDMDFFSVVAGYSS